MKRAIAIALPVLAAGVAAAQSAPEGPIPARPELLRFEPLAFAAPDREGRRFELGRGAVAYMEPDRTLPLVEITVAARVGAFLDPPGREGLARLTGTLMRRGGTERLSPEELDRRVDDLGATLDVRFGTLRGGATLDATRWTLDQALDLLFDVLARPRFDSGRLATARDELVQVMRRRNANPLDLLEREWAWLLFGTEHVSTRPPTPAAATAIAREDLVAFHRRYLRPEALIFAVSGDFEPEAMARALAGRLEGWPEPDPAGDLGEVAGGAGPSPPADWPPSSAHRPPAGLWLAPAETPQAKVLLGHPAPLEASWSVAERAHLDLMSEILGGDGAVSRIVGRLRTAEGLVYRAAASYDSEPPWPEGLRVFFETRTDGVPRALELAREEIERLRRQPVHPRELQVARETVIGRLRTSFDTARGVAGYLALDELLGRPPRYWEERFDAFRRATPELIRQTAERHLRPDRLMVLVVGRQAELATAPLGERLEAAAGAPITLLPRRDPLTLEPVAAGGASAREGSGADPPPPGTDAMIDRKID